MKYIFDAVLVLILLLCAFIGKKTGFVRCVLNLIKSVVAFIFAKIASDFASVYIFDNFIAKKLTEKITESLYVSSKLPGETVWESFPSFVQKILENAGLNSDNIFKLSDTATLSEMVNSTISAVEEILLPLLSLILLILFFVIISVLLGIVIKLIDKFFKLPVLNSLNKFLGMLVGFIFGILIVYVLCTYISDMIMLIPNEFSNVFSQLAETSKIKEFLAGLALK